MAFMRRTLPLATRRVAFPPMTAQRLLAAADLMAAEARVAEAATKRYANAIAVACAAFTP